MVSRYVHTVGTQVLNDTRLLIRYYAESGADGLYRIVHIHYDRAATLIRIYGVRRTN